MATPPSNKRKRPRREACNGKHADRAIDAAFAKAFPVEAAFQAELDAIAREIEAGPEQRAVPDAPSRGREQIGSLKLINGKWHWRYREAPDANGKRRRPDRIIGTVDDLPTKAAARIEAARLKAFVFPPRLAPGSSPPWREICARFLRVAVPLYRDGSREQFAYAIRNHLAPAFEKRRLHEVGLSEIQAFVAGQARSGAKRSSIRTRVGYLITLLGWCHDQGLAAVVPRRGAVKLPRPRDIELPPSELSYRPADEEIVLSLAAYPWRALYAVMFLAGLRVGETLALEWQHILLPPDVEPGEAQLRVRQAAVKGKIAAVKSRRSVRDVPICARLLAILTEYRDRSQPSASQLLFGGPRGQPRWSSGVQRHLDRFLLAHGIRPPRQGFHGMRRTFSRRLHEAGVPITVTRDLMGHGSLQAAAIYTESTAIEHRRAAVERASVVKVIARPQAENGEANRNDFSAPGTEKLP